ncbi:MAG: hypothetical protein UU80_C0005G0008 [candidate division WWE3 bacterium GW2011_GWA1_41_8]|jgi:hypothetical protein|uniref:Uncharacterized protein n=2 Tax=Katanobacteria TaxID=422282 RepID=A0A0G1ABA2_UNCKA|nr:MAG: hypothetical protein UU72_C0020G0006 [candidate division WWE3 bacterium GW2011_GWB1_41_6]KKS22563.1 MAG: hypothetical protein UU80_C0005G0008 [candidate division WWE3 bacterium GW2011_GWA1_41_8]
MLLNFVISTELLFITALLQDAEVEGWVDLQNHFWDKYHLGYRMLQGNHLDIFTSDSWKVQLGKATSEIEQMIDEGMKTDLYTKLLANAEDYKKWLEDEWVRNTDKIETELKNIVKTDLPDAVFTVYVMGNLMHVGRYLGNEKIAWGHKEEWDNYSLVYLVHEYLHEYFSYNQLEHAVIELIADNELRIRLNKSGEYFTCEGKSVGHEDLRDIENKILPYWQKYLADTSKNIYEFVDELKEKYQDN